MVCERNTTAFYNKPAPAEQPKLQCDIKQPRAVLEPVRPFCQDKDTERTFWFRNILSFLIGKNTF